MLAVAAAEEEPKVGFEAQREALTLPREPKSSAVADSEEPVNRRWPTGGPGEAGRPDIEPKGREAVDCSRAVRPATASSSEFSARLYMSLICWPRLDMRLWSPCI